VVTDLKKPCSMQQKKPVAFGKPRSLNCEDLIMFVASANIIAGSVDNKKSPAVTSRALISKTVIPQQRKCLTF
jgi:hypothetical protein